VPGAPQNTVIGGASLWVMAGKKPEEYKGVAAVPEPPVQARGGRQASHQRTGYLPVTKASFELTEKSGFYKQNPGYDVSVNQMIRKTTDKSRGVRLGNFVQIRTIIDEELEGVWQGKQAAQGGAGQCRQARQRATGALPEGQQVLIVSPRALAARRVQRRSPPTLQWLCRVKPAQAAV
jgi:ABC-type glycerol-3-phosphate transport system substrate-binding protein